MTTPAPRDLTAIVEKVARDHYERWVADLDVRSPSTHVDSWEDLAPMSAHNVRAHILPVVTATIRAIDEEES